MPSEADDTAANFKLYEVQRRIQRLQAELNTATAPAEVERLLADLLAAQAELSQLPPTARSAPAASEGFSVPGAEGRDDQGTAVMVTLRLCMSHIPTAIVHLFDVEEHPLVECQVENVSGRGRRLRVVTYVEGYSAQAVDTVDLEAAGKGSILQLPTFFPAQVRGLSELTRATVHVEVTDLASGLATEKTFPIWLLARNVAPLAVRNPSSGDWNDLSRYFGAFVTPNVPEIMRFLRRAAQHHPEGRLYGYQQDVPSQVSAIYAALKEDASITYVNSVVAFHPEEGTRSQRVRLPRQCLEEQQANCIDGVLLFASLLEAASLNPALVIVPGHALVGWQRSPDVDEWNYLETTMIGTNAFEEAADIGRRKAAIWSKQAETANDPRLFLRWSLSDLRTRYAITPLE